VQKLINSGYNTVPKIISMQLDDYLKIDGFKERLSLKIYQGIRDKIKEASIVTLMSASNSFGRGFSEKRIELIMEQFPDILISSLSANEKVSKVAGIKGMAYKSAEHFVEKIPVFLMFMNEADLKYKLYEEINKPKPKYDETHPLYNASIVMTGFRDESILKKIKEFGAKQGSSVSKNTSLVIVKDEYSLDTAKALEAQELGIPVISKQAFIEKYM
jgi:NAD-dependent DNA ligase